jgi:serine/threonine protein kinase
MTGGEEPTVVKNPLVGQIVQGRYRVDRLIGRGGMGVVYQAQHLLIGRKVALKVLSAYAAHSPERVERFRREALAAAGVGSSHVVDVLDMGQLDTGLQYIVLEHLDGADLAYAVAVAEQFAVTRAVHVLCQLCDALSAVHAAGIVHRDLKPENVFLISQDGMPDFVKVLDFGICKFLDATGAQLTETGEALGTPLFMAPEQVEGRRDVDHRADIYALGALLFFMLAGRSAFDAPSLPLLFVQICQEPPPRIRSLRGDVPSELDAIVQRALSKHPADRFGSCAELKAALSPFVHSEALRDTLPSLPPSRLPSRDLGITDALVRAHVPRRRPIRMAVLGAGLVVGGALALLRLNRSVESPPPLRERASIAPAPVAKEASQLALAKPSDDEAFPSAALRPEPAKPRAAATSAVAARREQPAPLSAPQSRAEVGSSPPPATTGEPAAASSPPSLVGLDLPLNREPKRGL